MTTPTYLNNARSGKEVNILNKYVVGSVVLCQLISFIAFGFNFYSQVAIFISLTQAILLFYNIGKIIPIRYLIGTMYSINYLVVPLIMFGGLNSSVAEEYSMVGNPDAYFSYVIPAILMLILGLHLFKNSDDCSISTKKIEIIAINSPRLPFYLILIGLICNFIVPYVPSEISLIFESASYFRFAGFFLSLFNNRPLNYMFLILSYGLLIITSLASSLFNDLLNMLFFLGFVLAIRYKASNSIKVAGIFAVMLLVVFIQIIKFPLRARVASGSNDLSQIDDVFAESNSQNANKTFDEKAADVLSRLDQGWVTSRSIAYYGSGGYELQGGKHALIILESAIFPRILVPEKLKVGDPQEFNKYSGHHVGQGTSIALGIVTDGFIDFGQSGIFEVFIFGLIISLFIRIYNNMDRKYPLVKIFLPIGFFYTVRPDNDSQAALGALFKLTFIIWMTMIYINNNYKLFAKIAKKVK